jgi:hypothetical protein
MKAKILYVMITLLLSTVGLTAKADVLLDPNTCSITSMGDLPHRGWIKAISCQGESTMWVAVLLKWDEWSPCFVSASNNNYRVAGTCEQYSIWRKT